MTAHYQQAARKASTQAVALGSLRGLKPGAMRQLYLSTVASKMDYAAPVWFKSQDKGTQIHKTYDMVQRIGGRVITGAFKSTAGGDLEVEAGLL